MKFIDDTLGIKTYSEPWSKAGKLPYYLNDSYKFTNVILDGISCLFITPKSELGSLTVIKKHIAKVRENQSVPVVLELDGISAKRRKSLMEARIPFVVTGHQIYLPFMGIALTERFLSEKPPNTILMPSSQLLLFYYLYQNISEMYTNGLADKFNLSPMQISRAVKQLAALNLVTVKKDGVQTVISNNTDSRKLFERAKPYLLDPIRKKIYVEYDTLSSGLTLSGISALAELTMLNSPVVKTFAFYGKNELLTGTEVMIDSDTQAEIEIWRYSPTLLSQKLGIVDSLSLIASLISTTDERIELAIDEILMSLWG